jgi:response regulator NasT
MRILVADDEPRAAEALTSLLEIIGHEVIGPAADGVEAVALAAREAPDLAILDIDMPRLSGLDAAARLAALHPVPVILLTAHNDPAYLARAATLPVFNYLSKPARPEALLAAIEIARARFAEWSRLNGRVAELTQRMEERRTVERAKGILMETRGLGEDAAYALLRSRSQKQGRAMIDICRAVVAAEGVLRRGAVAQVPVLPLAAAHDAAPGA